MAPTTAASPGSGRSRTDSKKPKTKNQPASPGPTGERCPEPQRPGVEVGGAADATEWRDLAVGRDHLGQLGRGLRYIEKLAPLTGTSIGLPRRIPHNASHSSPPNMTRRWRLSLYIASCSRPRPRRSPGRHDTGHRIRPGSRRDAILRRNRMRSCSRRAGSSSACCSGRPPQSNSRCLRGTRRRSCPRTGRSPDEASRT